MAVLFSNCIVGRRYSSLSWPLNEYSSSILANLSATAQLVPSISSSLTYLGSLDHQVSSICVYTVGQSLPFFTIIIVLCTLKIVFDDSLSTTTFLV